MASGSGRCGINLTWMLDNGTLTIKGKGEMENYHMLGNSPPWYSVSIERIIIKDGITNIGNVAFQSCWQLQRIEIPKSVVTIGFYALSYCTNLQDVKISEGLHAIAEGAFYGCTSLKKIIIPESVKRIGERAFSYCNNLTEIKIPVNIKEIEINAFSGCTTLKKIYYPAELSFVNRLRMGNNAKLIPYTPPPAQVNPLPHPVDEQTSPLVVKQVAQVREKLLPLWWKERRYREENNNTVEQLRWKVEGKTLTVGGVSEIKSYSYEETPWRDSFRDIQRIIIEDGVKKIAANAFAECTRLEQLTIPVSVKTIGDGAFTFCYCGDRTINGGRNVIWSLEDGTLMIKKNPAAKNESNFSTGYETWQVVEGSITGVKIERGIVPANSFFDWVNRMGDGVSVAF